MSRDAYHEDVGRWYRELDCSAEDTHRLGKGFPDWIVGIDGVTDFVETKVAGDERPPRERKRLSARCAECGKTYRRHTLGTARAPGAGIPCTTFVRQYVTAPARGGVVSRRQAKWHRTWRGSPVRVVRTEQDVVEHVADMRRRAAVLTAGDGQRRSVA